MSSLTVLRPKSAVEPRHFLDIDRVSVEDLRGLIDRAASRKRARLGQPKGRVDADAALDGRVVALIFEKPSTRTRVSFDVGIRQLGGESIVLNAGDMQLGRGETIFDTAHVLSRYVDAIMIRCGDHASLMELAAHATVPVINGLTNRSHPCQIMADILTFEERLGPIEGRKIAWVGDGNNVAASWIHAAAKFGFTIDLACPKELSPAADTVAAAGGAARVLRDPREAVQDADCVVTDTWVSMSDPEEARAERTRLLTPYRVDAALMAAAKPGAIFMHDLPAHRGDEVTAEVMDGPQSVIFDEAENRLHAQKAILDWCVNVET